MRIIIDCYLQGEGRHVTQEEGWGGKLVSPTFNCSSTRISARYYTHTVLLREGREMGGIYRR
jgi:hypothetical protein